MSAREDLRATDVQVNITLSTTTGYVFIAPTPIRVHRVGVIMVANPDADVAISFVHSTPDGSAITGGEPTIGMVVPSSGITGEVYYKNAENFTNGKPQLYLPGEAILAVSDGITTVGAAVPFLEYQPEPFLDLGFARSAPTAAVTSPADTTRLANMTRVVPV